MSSIAGNDKVLSCPTLTVSTECEGEGRSLVCAHPQSWGAQSGKISENTCMGVPWVFRAFKGHVQYNEHVSQWLVVCKANNIYWISQLTCHFTSVFQRLYLLSQPCLPFFLFFSWTAWSPRKLLCCSWYRNSPKAKWVWQWSMVQAMEGDISNIERVAGLNIFVRPAALLWRDVDEEFIWVWIWTQDSGNSR